MPWTVARHAPLSMEFPRQEYWSRLPFPPPRGSSQPKDRTCVSCTCRWALYQWATGKPQTAFFYLFVLFGYKNTYEIISAHFQYICKKKKKTFKTKIWPNCFIRQDQLYPLEKYFLEKTWNLLKNNTLIILIIYLYLDKIPDKIIFKFRGQNFRII